MTLTCKARLATDEVAGGVDPGVVDGDPSGLALGQDRQGGLASNDPKGESRVAEAKHRCHPGRESSPGRVG